MLARLKLFLFSCIMIMAGLTLLQPVEARAMLVANAQRLAPSQPEEHELFNPRLPSPGERIFKAWMGSDLPLELPENTGIASHPIVGLDHVETLIVYFVAEDTENPEIKRIIEVSPGIFDVYVSKGSVKGRFVAVVIDGWDANWVFRLKRE